MIKNVYTAQDYSLNFDKDILSKVKKYRIIRRDSVEWTNPDGPNWGLTNCDVGDTTRQPEIEFSTYPNAQALSVTQLRFR